MTIGPRVRVRTDAAPNTDKLGTRIVRNLNGTIFSSTEYFCSTPYKQRCEDFLNVRVRPRHKNGKRKKVVDGRRFLYLSGSPLLLSKVSYKANHSQHLNLKQGIQEYSGVLMCSRFGSNPGLGAYLVDTADLNAAGARGVAKSRPGNPTAGLGQALIELRQLPRLPSALKSKSVSELFNRLSDFRQLGREYLNVEFGWKPFLRDLRDLYNFQQDLGRQLDQLRRDNGKTVRRRCQIDRNHSSNYTSDVGTPGTYPGLVNALLAPVPDAQRFSRYLVTESYTRTWFSGAFRYWIPDINSAEWPERAKRALLGLNPSPGLLWEVLPWSWLIDWFSSVGDSVNNMSSNAAENLVMRYGFCMKTTVDRQKAVAQTKLYNGSWATASMTYERTVKRRARANPFGFGTNLDALTGRQAAILAALGISKRWFS